MNTSYECRKCGGSFAPEHTYCPACDEVTVQHTRALNRLADLLERQPAPVSTPRSAGQGGDGYAKAHGHSTSTVDASYQAPKPVDPLRDALDHIMRVARQGIQPTRRLDWIEIRARYALEGKEWSGDIRETPRDSVRELVKQNEKLRQDAGRYRWLRKIPNVVLAGKYYGDRLDEEIDAAIGSTGPGTGRAAAQSEGKVKETSSEKPNPLTTHTGKEAG